MSLERLKAKIIKQLLDKKVLNIKAALETDIKKGEVQLFNERMLLIPSMGFANLHGATRKLFGPSAPAVIRAFGESCGRRVLEVWQNILKVPLDLKLFTDMAPVFCSAAGWCRVVKIDFNLSEGKGEILVKNSFEAEATMKIYGKRDVPQCYFLGDFIKAMINEISGKTCQIEETRCEARGDELCEFQIVLK